MKGGRRKGSEDKLRDEFQEQKETKKKQTKNSGKRSWNSGFQRIVKCEMSVGMKVEERSVDKEVRVCVCVR